MIGYSRAATSATSAAPSRAVLATVWEAMDQLLLLSSDGTRDDMWAAMWARIPVSVTEGLKDV